LRSNFRRKFAPDSIHAREWDDWWVFSYLNLGESHGTCVSAGGEEYEDDERSEGVLSLLEENARLRGLVVKLTEIILRNVADRG